MQARAGLAIPPLKSVANSSDFLDPPGMPKHNAQIFLDAIDYAKIQQLPRQQEWWSDIIQNSAAPAIQQGTATTEQAAKVIEKRWLNVLDSPLNRREFSTMRWSTIVWITIAALLTVAVALWTKARRERLGPLDRAQERAGFLFISPWLIGFFALTLGPMVVSLLLSFTKWTAMAPMSNAQAVGLANYQQMFTSDDVFAQSLKVTLYFVVLAVPISQALALGIAVLMNARVRGITIFRTIYFVPSVVSGVALAVLWRQIFNNDYGLMNAGLRKVLAFVHAAPPDWFGRDADAWAIPAFVIMGLWGVGGGMIIYLAGLKGIPASMYEAATIDGASAFRRFWNVTLPMLSPLIFYNIVMGIIGSFQIFTQAQVMTGGGPNNATLFYVLNLYRQAFEFHQMGYASALAWVLFLIILVLTIIVFRASRNLVYYEGLKT
jgi:multiple sugar transport system permease protein